MNTHKVRITMQIGSGLEVSHESEFIIEGEDEAFAAGKKMAGIVSAFSAGYARADLSNWDQS